MLWPEEIKPSTQNLTEKKGLLLNVFCKLFCLHCHPLGEAGLFFPFSKRRGPWWWIYRYAHRPAGTVYLSRLLRLMSAS